MSVMIDMSDMINCAKNYFPGLPISDDVLNRPSSEFVVNLCLKFLQSFGIDTDNIMNMTPNQMASASNSSAIHDISILINLATVMHSVLESSGCSYLTVADLVEPTARRTKGIFKTIMNFMVFVNTKNKDRINAIVQEAEDHTEHVAALCQKKDVITCSLSQAYEESAELKEAKQRLCVEERKVSEDAEKMEKELDVIEGKNQQLRNKLELKVNEAQDKAAFYETLCQKEDNLRQQIVDEPEVYIKQCEQLRSEFNKIDCDEQLELNRQKQQQHDTAEDVVAALEKIQEAFATIDCSQKEQVELNKHLNNIKKEISDTAHYMDELNAKKQILVQKENSLLEEKTSVQLRHANVMKAMEDDLVKLEQELQTAGSSRNAADKKYQCLLREFEIVKRETKEAKENYNENCAKLEWEYERTLSDHMEIREFMRIILSDLTDKFNN